MNVAVWDTYVKRQDGLQMHFDILVPEEVRNSDQVFEYIDQYLEQKNFLAEDVRSGRCQFCHMEQASEDVISIIDQRGYYILEFENCN
ncbi:MAG: DUF2024 family protein [Reichenbachiella sp.]|uniref:DUF2024 family protein n=1 Tax=Reichenbachiella sp. TaxID=2184521 RepID=UPI0032637F33